jgi:hypothetical protein
MKKRKSTNLKSTKKEKKGGLGKGKNELRSNTQENVLKASPIGSFIRSDSDYGGFRVRLEAHLENAKIRLQVDIGFGDAIIPEPEETEYPTLLEVPPPRIRAYPREAVVAEKLHAIVVMGSVNSRMKDFYDLFVLSTNFAFSSELLSRAIVASFSRRDTLIPVELPVGLGPGFFAEKGRTKQWSRYLEKNDLPGAPMDFDQIGETLRSFLELPVAVLAQHRRFSANWEAGGPWR